MWYGSVICKEGEEEEDLLPSTLEAEVGSRMQKEGWWQDHCVGSWSLPDLHVALPLPIIMHACIPQKQLETPIPCHITHLTMLISKNQQSEAGTQQNHMWTLISINRKRTLVLHQNKKMTVAPVTSFWPVFDWCGDKRVGLPQHLACICTAEVYKPDVRPASFFAHRSYRSVYTQEGRGSTSYS